MWTAPAEARLGLRPGGGKIRDQPNPVLTIVGANSGQIKVCGAIEMTETHE
jgi:hypothetical protein